MSYVQVEILKVLDRSVTKFRAIFPSQRLQLRDEGKNKNPTVLYINSFKPEDSWLGKCHTTKFSLFLFQPWNVVVD